MGASKKEFMDIREKSLYHIENEYLAIEKMLMENEGELTEAINKALVINKEELKQKSINYVSVIKKMTTDVNYIDEEIKRLTAIKKQQKNAIDRLKENIKNAMIIFDVDKIETPLIKLSLRKSESIEIKIPIDELPKKIQKIEIKTINKNEIKKMLKNGDKIKGVELIHNKSLQIK